jgi:hypothetical protein
MKPFSPVPSYSLVLRFITKLCNFLSVSSAGFSMQFGVWALIGGQNWASAPVPGFWNKSELKTTEIHPILIPKFKNIFKNVFYPKY